MRKALEEFVNHLALDRQYSPNTVKAYRRDVDGFIEFLEDRAFPTTAQNVDSIVIRRYLGSLFDDGATTATVQRKAYALKKLFGFLSAEGKISQDPTYRIRRSPMPLLPPIGLEPHRLHR